MHRTHDERIAAMDAAKTRKRDIIRQMGMDPDDNRRIRRIKDCTHRNPRPQTRELLREFFDEQEADSALAS